MDLQENYTITVRMYKVGKKISVRQSTSRWPVSHIGLDTVNTAQKAVGPEGQLHVCRRETRKNAMRHAIQSALAKMMTSRSGVL